MHRILITGGAGFIGTHLAERLLNAAEIVLFDSFHRDSLQYAPALLHHDRVTILSGDVTDQASVEAAMDGVGTVIHLAAIAGVSSYYSQPLKTLQTNILGTVNVLERAAKQNVKQLVYFSTSEVYGANALWVNEEAVHAIGPVADARWVYATSKLAGENFAYRYAEQYGFSLTAVRPFNIYGPRQIGEGAISNFARAVAGKKPLCVYGDGAAIRAWCYITDLVDAVEAILKSPATSPQIMNIGNPVEIETTLGLARRMAKLEPEVKIEFRPGVHSEVRARIPNIDRARQAINFEAKVSLDEGLAQTIAWFKEHHDRD